MDRNQFEGKWNEYVGKIKEKWGKLTNDDLAEIRGKRDALIGKIQARYGYAKEKVERELSEFEKSCGCGHNEHGHHEQKPCGCRGPCNCGHNQQGHCGQKSCGCRGPCNCGNDHHGGHGHGEKPCGCKGPCNCKRD